MVVLGAVDGVFELRDRARIALTPMGERERFEAVFTGTLQRVSSPLGEYSVGDFSEWTTPGIYQVVVPGAGGHSYQFTITDGAFSWIPGLLLDFVHAWRSGSFENAWRGPSHLDDGLRSDNGAQADAVGGWYDAGDVRKWMVHSNLPALAFLEAHDALGWRYADWERVEEGWSPWLLEARWGLDFMLKMQDPASGMFFEDVGGGGEGRRKPGASWWYENHSGCYADNAFNRFTDNRAQSGDERPIRVQYNPHAQFTSVAILARAAVAYGRIDPARSSRYAAAAESGWRLGLSPEARYAGEAGAEFAAWTSVRSWRCLAALALQRSGHLPWPEVQSAADAVLANFDTELGFWVNQHGGRQPFRGILHSAQPLIALAEVAHAAPDGPWRDALLGVLRTCVGRYVVPLCGLSPFGAMPFGVYSEPVSEGDLYRPWRDGYSFRYFMPELHPQRINHGLAGHWTSWAHALALVGRLLGDARCTALAWSQLHWLLGMNPFNASVLSGVGYNNPMPHSRFLGTFPGGFCNGFNGSPDDQPLLDQEGWGQWNTTEYWMTPIANSLLALGVLEGRGPALPRRLGLGT